MILINPFYHGQGIVREASLCSTCSVLLTNWILSDIQRNRTTPIGIHLQPF